jgi:hypothetical protein
MNGDLTPEVRVDIFTPKPLPECFRNRELTQAEPA